MSEQFPNDSLRILWDDQGKDLQINDLKELTMNLQEVHRQEQRRLLWLNVQEIVPAIGMFLWFSWQGMQATTRPWAWFAAAATAFGVAAYLGATSLRQHKRELAFPNTTRGELERALSQMAHRANLYRTVTWWYLIPCALGITFVLIAAEVPANAPLTLGYAVFAIAFLAGLYRWNRKIGREKYEPKVAQLSQLISQLGAN